MSASLNCVLDSHALTSLVSRSVVISFHRRSKSSPGNITQSPTRLVIIHHLRMCTFSSHCWTRY